MAQKARPLGPAALSVIERAPFAFICDVLSSGRSDGEPEYGLPDAAEAETDGTRQQVIDALNRFDEEDLRPLEQRCRRICRLSEGKGVSSLDTIAEQLFTDEQHSEYSKQLDPLCRSIWTYNKFLHVFSFFFVYNISNQRWHENLKIKKFVT